MPSRPMARTRSSTERVEMPWTLGSSPRAGSGFLDDRGQRLLGQAPGLQEGREVAPLAQLGNPQFDRAGTGLPVPVAVAVAMVTPFGAALALAGAAQDVALQTTQPLGRKADHLAQECRIGALPQKGAKGELVLGHRGGPRVRWEEGRVGKE